METTQIPMEPPVDVLEDSTESLEISAVTTRPARHRPDDFRSEGDSEFSYRPVPVLAVVGLVLAIISGAGVFIWMVLPLCLLAVLTSTLGYWTIRRCPEGYSGKSVALGGMFLGTAFFLGGIGLQVYTYRTEVPEGYERLSFASDISEKEILTENGEMKPHPEIAALEGKKIFLKGYIYQTGQLKDIGAFLLVKDNQDCCFGGKPKLWDRLGVVMQDGKKIDYRAGKVAIAGTFRLNPKFQGNDELEPIYIVEGDHFSSRVSDF